MQTFNSVKFKNKSLNSLKFKNKSNWVKKTKNQKKKKGKGEDRILSATWIEINSSNDTILRNAHFGEVDGHVHGISVQLNLFIIYIYIYIYIYPIVLSLSLSLSLSH